MTVKQPMRIKQKYEMYEILQLYVIHLSDT